MDAIIERAKREAKRRWPLVNQPTFGPDDYMDMGARSGFEAGAIFAATITPEQVAAFKRGWEEADARGESGSRVIAGLRAMGLRIEEI